MKLCLVKQEDGEIGIQFLCSEEEPDLESGAAVLGLLHVAGGGSEEASKIFESMYKISRLGEYLDQLALAAFKLGENQEKRRMAETLGLKH